MLTQEGSRPSYLSALGADTERDAWHRTGAGDRVLDPGEEPSVVEVGVPQQAGRLGGDVRYRDDDPGYLRVRVPIDRASELAEFDRIEAVATDYEGSYPNRLRPDEKAQLTTDPPVSSRPQNQEVKKDSEQWPPRWSDYPRR